MHVTSTNENNMGNYIEAKRRGAVGIYRSGMAWGPQPYVLELSIKYSISPIISFGTARQSIFGFVCFALAYCRPQLLLATILGPAGPVLI